MGTMDVERIVEDYLRRLDAAAAGLPAERRAELVADIREHIDAALHAQGDEVDARNVLERLGPPEQIAAEATDDAGASRMRTSGTFEVVALVVLALGGFVIPVLGYLAGVALVLGSKTWSMREKQIGLLLPFLLLYLPVVVVAMTSGSWNLGMAELVLLPVLFGGLAGLVGAVYLAVRLRRRRV